LHKPALAGEPIKSSQANAGGDCYLLRADARKNQQQVQNALSLTRSLRQKITG